MVPTSEWPCRKRLPKPRGGGAGGGIPNPLFQSENVTRAASQGVWPGQPRRSYTPGTALGPTLRGYHPDILKTQGTGGPCVSTLPQVAGKEACPM